MAGRMGVGPCRLSSCVAGTVDEFFIVFCAASRSSLQLDARSFDNLLLTHGCKICMNPVRSVTTASSSPDGSACEEVIYRHREKAEGSGTYSTISEPPKCALPPPSSTSSFRDSEDFWSSSLQSTRTVATGCTGKCRIRCRVQAFKWDSNDVTSACALLLSAIRPTLHHFIMLPFTCIKTHRNNTIRAGRPTSLVSLLADADFTRLFSSVPLSLKHLSLRCCPDDLCEVMRLRSWVLRNCMASFWLVWFADTLVPLRALAPLAIVLAPLSAVWEGDRSKS